MKYRYDLLFAIILSIGASSIDASSLTVDVFSVTQKGHGKSIGHVVMTDSIYGLRIAPNLLDLTPGIHGLHIHQKPDCSNNGLAAGGHLDPRHTGKHLGPYNGRGHLGDLPALTVLENGTASLPTLAPRLTTSMIRNRALMVHSGGDNYSDTPPMGGGENRIACGVIR